MTARTREEWLQHAVEAMGPWIDELDEPGQMPPVRISVGWPSRGGTSTKRRVVGQCWTTASSADGVGQIFISPVRGEGDVVDVLATVLHEMNHAADDCESGHRGAFARRARALGFAAPLTASCPTEELRERLEGISERLGPFPHAALASHQRAADEPKKQSARMLKMVCPEDGYTARTSRKWLDVGLPTCPCGTEMEEA